MTAAFDHWILTLGASAGEAASGPSAYLARGRPLVELKRFDEAEADFKKAVELAPGDIDVLLARAAFHAERGDVPQARVEFEAALNRAVAAKPTQGDTPRMIVECEIGRYTAVLDEWQTQSNHAQLWRIRGQQQIRLGNWKQAAEALEHGVHFTHSKFLTALYCLLGDADGFQRACLAHFERMPSEWDDAAKDYDKLYILGLRPVTGEPAEELTRLMESHLADPPGPAVRRRRVSLGAALYRHARYDEALRFLDDGLAARVPQWQGDAQVWPLLAMTHWQLGHHDEARKWLARSDWWHDLAGHAADVGHAIGPNNITYDEWLRAQVFYAEAKSLIERDTPKETTDKQAP